jgi:hypothetical protein
MNWDEKARKTFESVLAKIPVFLRSIAEKKVSQRAEEYACHEGRQEISEKDVIDAYFKETPFGFHGPMKTDMEALGIDYKKYGHSE